MGYLTKRQHYVWQHHIDAWLTSEKIWCYIKSNDKIFNTSTENVANMRFFYQAVKLTDADLTYLRKEIFPQIKQEELRELAHGYVSMFTLADRLEDNLKELDLSDETRKKLVEELEWTRKMLGERYHGGLEGSCIGFLESLRNADCSFIENEQSAIEFFHFLANQYFRTPRMRTVCRSMASIIPDHSFERTWTVEAYIYACNVAYSMFARRNIDLISFIHNETDVPFITGDQPISNLLGSKDANIDLFYPLSPRLAMRISEKPEHRERTICKSEVIKLNKLIFLRADDQIYSNDGVYLRKFIREAIASENSNKSGGDVGHG